MTKFRIIATARADIEETWEAELPDEIVAQGDAAIREALEEELSCSAFGGATFIGDTVTGEEEERALKSFERIEPSTATSPLDGPYRPELAEAFRQGARELQLDRLDIREGALVEEGEGGAYVTCRVYVSDAERLPMPGEDEANG